MSSAVPDWCEVRRGTGRVLLVAPHGGRRAPIDPLSPPANLRVNDVYTPEVTRALAERLDAGAIINCGVDRNHIDLNRATQVRKHAPWFLELLVREVASVVDRHGECEVVFIHGWNNGQLKCDIGLGGVERDGEIVAPPDRYLSVSREYLDERVDLLRRACQARGISAPVGEKYPASHPNNLVQLFAARPGAEDLFAGLAAAGKVNAVQLELTLPLRCPGTWRDEFLAALAEAYQPRQSQHPVRAQAHSGGFTGDRDASPPASAESIQFYDAATGIGLFAGVGRMGPKSMGGRLLLFLGGQRIALFTGEEMGTRGVPPLRFERRGSTLGVRFRGPILMIEDAAEYLDLEAALAASTAVEADLAVDFAESRHAAGSATFGEVRGELRLAGRGFGLETKGFGHIAGLRAASAAQTMLAASFDGGRALVTRLAHDTAGSSAIHFLGADDIEVLDSVTLRVIEDGDAYTPAAFELVSPAHPRLRAEPINRMAILRGAPQGYIRVAFGVARFDWDGKRGYGLYEHALPLPAARPA